MISIVTAYYNRKQLFINTLKSIKQQNSKFLLEVIAVDDGSEENERLEDLVAEFPFLKVIRLEKKNKWYHNSCIPFNVGFKAAKGDKIIIQNPECFHYGSILNYTEKNANQNSYLSFGCFSLDKESTKKINEIVTVKRIKEIIKKNDETVQNDGDAGWYNHSVYRPEAFHFCTAITQKNLKKLGGFDELYALGIGYDDNEFIWRVRKLGLNITFVDDEIALHQNHYSLCSKSFENRKNKENLYLRNFDILNNITKKRGYKANFRLNIPILSVRTKIEINNIYWRSRIGLISSLKSLKMKSQFFKTLFFGEKLVRDQLKNPKYIPIIIINFNQLKYLKRQVEFWQIREHKNIIIIDNNSSYKPLLEYYEKIKDQVTVEKMTDNYGHMVFFNNSGLLQKYGKGFYVITDADVLPNENLPDNFMRTLIRVMLKFNSRITKVGFALDISDLPDYFFLKEKVLKWESQFWKKEIDKDIYLAEIDTTFALYKPGYRYSNQRDFLKAIRLGEDFTAKHGGWYLNPHDFSEEDLFFIRTVDKSSSWKLNEEGNHDNKSFFTYR